jgi:hypothetical protein
VSSYSQMPVAKYWYEKIAGGVHFATAFQTNFVTSCSVKLEMRTLSTIV